MRNKMPGKGRFSYSRFTTAACLIGVVALAGLAVGASGFVSTAPETNKVVRAERFELVDKTGKVRAALVSDDAGSELIWFDESEEAQMMLGMKDGFLYLKSIPKETADAVSGKTQEGKSLSQYWHFPYGPRH